jgi:hypothetical protein
VPGRWLPPDPDAGDESTLGGYMAVHARPAAFDGPDGLPYSAEIMTDAVSITPPRHGAYVMFMQWRRMGEPGIEAHLETDFLAFAGTADEARAAVGRLSLHEVKAHLDRLVRERGGGTGRPWYDAMRDDRTDA